MAKRPVFVPDSNDASLVAEQIVEFKWFPGFSLKQKQRSIQSLHKAAEADFDLVSLLEISSKSPFEMGICLSAFNLLLEIPHFAYQISVESAFQGSKVFEDGGPFTDLYEKTAREAKKDIRLQTTGELRSFQFAGEDWPLEPKTAFYDWLYLSALQQQPDLAQNLPKFRGFTDIEFNPQRSINCQARSAALYVSLLVRDLLDKVMQSKDAFLSFMAES